MNPRISFTWAICALFGTYVAAQLASGGLWNGSSFPTSAYSNHTDENKLSLDQENGRGDASPEYSSDREVDGTIAHTPLSVPPPNADNPAGQGQSPQQVDQATSNTTGIADAPASKRIGVEVRSALLKDHDGVKITGTCNAKFQVILVPHISISVEAESNTIQISRMIENVTTTKEWDKGDGNSSQPLQFEENIDSLLNQCTEGRTFKFVVIIKGKELILKWKVYEEIPSATENTKVDVRKYALKNLGLPITAIQVHSGKEDSNLFLLKSKAYFLRKDIPRTCERIVTSCYLSGNVDIHKCFQFTLLMENHDTMNECSKYVSSEVTDKFKGIKIEAQDNVDPEEIQLRETIDRILNWIYRIDEDGKKVLIMQEELDLSMKEDLTNYCQIMKKVDKSGTLEEHQIGGEMDVLTNLKGVLKNHSHEELPTLEGKLKIPAICMKDASKWVVNKRGLVLPPFEYKHLQRRVITSVDSQEENKLADKEGVIKDMHMPGYRAVIDLSQKGGVNHSDHSGEMFCNEDYCNRWKDRNSCFARIETEEQGNCNLSWLFASKLHLETIKCMKGYDHVATSALYVANCSSRGNKSKCISGSNPYEFLTIVEENGFLPPALLLPYSYGKVGNTCPKQQDHWQNLWSNVKLLEPSYEPNSVSTKGYTSYESDDFRGNIERFVNLVKREVKNRGSIMAYVKAMGVLGYDFNGKEVQSLCGDRRPDHAVNIIGYGNYINVNGEKRSYWLIRNSWGYYWGNEGNFRVDVYAPPGCQHNFIHTAAAFNVDVPVVKSTSQREPPL
uniref:Pkn-SERA1 protein n=1 Tax=Plasmodium knowlesi TaxID=5850 RepID=F1SZ10_PLAKN|nr:Pkn-SERA1 [Plasmodium knowlesi]